MNLTDEEVKTLDSILKVEIADVQELIKISASADRAELKVYLEKVKAIKSKLI